MEATAQQSAQRPQFKRRVRNYLIDPRFQLRWVFFVVLVISLIMGGMGYILYDTVADATDQMIVAQMAVEGLSPEAVEAFKQDGENAKLWAIIWLAAGWLVLVLFLSGVTIVLTHKVSGPVFKMKRLLGDIDGDHLQLWEKLRKGDELQDAFEAFDAMVRRLREARHQDIETLEQIRAQLGQPATAAAASQILDELIERFRASVRME
jgi:methyl-accepting chemotaxis protein